MVNFVKGFECQNESHVMWLKKVGGAMARATGGGDKVDIIGIVNDNPIEGNPKMDNPMDWAYIHFQLAMKYTNAVLNGEAFVPPPK
ncbi:MAG: hypothetical protein HOM38_08410 [Euryarchaeota archaeon]|jgi:hypothetical protein|nr:hypothetical protein [Euryarchaeota archaeon]